MSGCKWKAGAGQTIGGIFRWLGVFAPSEPDGVPLMAGGERVGTIAPDGTLILKPGLDYRPLFNGQIQGQTKEPEVLDPPHDISTLIDLSLSLLTMQVNSLTQEVARLREAMAPERAFQLARAIIESAGAVGFTAAVAGRILEAWRQGCDRRKGCQHC